MHSSINVEHLAYRYPGVDNTPGVAVFEDEVGAFTKPCRILRIVSARLSDVIAKGLEYLVADLLLFVIFILLDATAQNGIQILPLVHQHRVKRLMIDAHALINDLVIGYLQPLGKHGTVQCVCTAGRGFAEMV